MSNFKYGKRSKAKLYGDAEHPGVAKEVSELCELALSYSTVDFGIIDGFRLTHEQQHMYKIGNSELDGVNKLSSHQIGLAIDVLPSNSSGAGKGLDMFDVSTPEVRAVWLEVYRAFMRAAMKLGLSLEFGLGYNIHGGRDWPHIQVVGHVNKSKHDMALPPRD